MPVFSKGLERIIFVRLSDFLKKYNVLTTKQFGFRQHSSTELALLRQKELILTNIENKLITLGIFVDFSKAFDRMNHRTLLLKLSAYGIRNNMLNLICNYLSDRVQCVSIESFQSAFKSVKHGVPQGSLLGPLLFNIYINDLIRIDKEVEYVMYADDTSLFLTGEDVNSLVGKANLVLAKLHTWSIKNALLVNSAKTKAIFFRAKNTTYDLRSTLSLGTNEIQITNVVKSLGVYFSEFMLWDAHFEHLQTKLSRTVGILRKLRHMLPVKTKLILYFALFESNIRYCNLIWGSSTATNISKLSVLQNGALKAIANAPSISSSHNLYSKYNIIKLTSFYDFRLLQLYKSLSERRAPFLEETIILQKNTHSHQTRHHERWYVPRPRTNYGFQTLNYALPTLLNRFGLPNSCDRLPSYQQIKTFFL